MNAPHSLFCLGNPLLAMHITDGGYYMNKYKLQANDHILAEDKHMPM
jgi:adenosine kinase